MSNRTMRWRTKPSRAAPCYWKEVGFSLGESYPVACVSWNDAMTSIAWLNRETGGGYRLPTEAEWECAARAGTTRARSWGNGVDGNACRYANVADENTSQGTVLGSKYKFPSDDGHNHAAPVGSKRPNPWGLSDMLGNVWTGCKFPCRFSLFSFSAA